MKNLYNTLASHLLHSNLLLRDVLTFKCSLLLVVWTESMEEMCTKILLTKRSMLLKFCMAHLHASTHRADVTKALVVWWFWWFNDMGMFHLHSYDLNTPSHLTVLTDHVHPVSVYHTLSVTLSRTLLITSKMK